MSSGGGRYGSFFKSLSAPRASGAIAQKLEAYSRYGRVLKDSGSLDQFFDQYARLRSENKCMFYCGGEFCGKPAFEGGDGIAYKCEYHTGIVANITRLYKYIEGRMEQVKSDPEMYRLLSTKIVRLRNLVNIHLVPDRGHVNAALYYTRASVNVMYRDEHGRLIEEVRNGEKKEIDRVNEDFIPRNDIETIANVTLQCHRTLIELC